MKRGKTKKEIKDIISEQLFNLETCEKTPHISEVSFIRGELYALYSIYNEDAFFFQALERLKAQEGRFLTK